MKNEDNLKNKKNPSNINIHPSKQRLNCTKNANAKIYKCKLQHDDTWASTTNIKQYEYTVSILYTYTHTHTCTSEHHSQTTENPKLYNISAIRTVAQNTIMIYSNTFFFFYDKLKLSAQKEMQSTSHQRPQKCMLSGQLEATRRKELQEGSGALPRPSTTHRSALQG